MIGVDLLGVLAGLLGLLAAVPAAVPADGPPVARLSVPEVAMVVLGASMLLAVVRLVRGPTLADRVIALDLLAFFAAGVVAIAAVVAERSELLMVAVVIALLTFMGTAAFALYLERKGREDADYDPLTWLEYATLLLGVAFCLLAGIGIVRMPDVYTRMQASTKAGTLGISLIVAAVGLHFRDAVTGLQAALVIGFLFLTAPIASHLIARAAYVLKASVWEGTVIDEMAGCSPAATTSRVAADEDEHAEDVGRP